MLASEKLKKVSQEGMNKGLGSIPEHEFMEREWPKDESDTEMMRHFKGQQ
jgi:hypothetical protein